jgi:OmpA-OmpF porin, OOP family
MRKHLLLSGLAALSLASSVTAHAEEAPGFYAGASFGQASIEIDDAGFDGSDTAFKIFGGYGFNPYFAVELGWFNGGTADERFGPFVVEVEMSGLVASAVGRLPVGDAFTLFGKLGFASYDAEVSANGFGGDDTSDEDLAYGIGGQFQLGQAFGLRAEYEIVDVSDANFNMFSVGGLYRF